MIWKIVATVRRKQQKIRGSDQSKMYKKPQSLHSEKVMFSMFMMGKAQDEKIALL